MLDNFKNVLYLFLKKIYLLPIINLFRSSIILEKDYGHFKSALIWSAVDRNNNPIPWYSYPAIEWIKKLNLKKIKIFEYGSGNSTYFWSKQCKNIVSVENNLSWYKKVNDLLKTQKNTKLIYEPNKRKYIETISQTKEKFDLIIIDGSFRKDCSTKALKYLKKDGAIILDNADWFRNTAKILREKGLSQIDLIGFGPINHYVTNTAFFIKNDFLKNVKYLDRTSFVLGGIKNKDD